MTLHTSNTDMISAARHAQWNQEDAWGPDVLKAVSPAKVNLFLAVGDKRTDGFHDVTTIMHALALHDVLYFAAVPLSEEAFEAAQGNPQAVFVGPRENLLVTLDVAELGGIVPREIPLRENLIVEAIDALAHAVSYENRERIFLRLEKAIPYEAGLGGGSSNAAAALACAATTWGFDPLGQKTHDVAISLGSDVAFFLHGGCALFDGRGEHFVHELESSRAPVVLVTPPMGVSTKDAYARFDEQGEKVDDEAIEQATWATKADEVHLANNLVPAAEALLPELKDIASWLASCPGVQEVLLSGSGSTTFAKTTDFTAAMNAVAEANKRGYWARATTFSSLHAAVMPQEKKKFPHVPHASEANASGPHASDPHASDPHASDPHVSGASSSMQGSQTTSAR